MTLKETRDLLGFGDLKDVSYTKAVADLRRKIQQRTAARKRLYTRGNPIRRKNVRARKAPSAGVTQASPESGTGD